jgi:asparagine synthetase B (glutamine-hydrolysing)
MAQISRRTLLQAAAATTGGVLLSGGLDSMVAQASGGRPDRLTLGPA